MQQQLRQSTVNNNDAAANIDATTNAGATTTNVGATTTTNIHAAEAAFARIPLPLHRTLTMKATSTPQGASDDNVVNGIVAANELLHHVLARQDAQIQGQHNNGGQGIHEQVARLTHQVNDTQTSIESLETTVKAQGDNIREILRILHGMGSED